jgi:hypothetical protein
VPFLYNLNNLNTVRTICTPYQYAVHTLLTPTGYNIMNTGPDSRTHGMGYEKRGGVLEKKDGGWNINFREFDVAEQLEGVPLYKEDPKGVRIPFTRKVQVQQCCE